MSGIFISYRREETAAYAGRIRDRLVQEFGQSQVFMDVDTIDLGVDFTKVIDEAVAEVDILLCIIGKDWLKIDDESGKRRIDDSADFVRLEIANAIKRDIRVIPILVRNAEIPTADQLPPDLSSLSNRNALKLSDSRFHTDVDQLIKSIRKLLDKADTTPVDNDVSKATENVANDDSPHQNNKKTLFKWLIPLGFAVLLIGIGGYFWQTWQQAKLTVYSKAELTVNKDALQKAELDKKLKAQEEAKLTAEKKAQRKAELAAKLKAEEARRMAEFEQIQNISETSSGLKIKKFSFVRTNNKALRVLITNGSHKNSDPRILLLTIRRIGESTVARKTKVLVPRILRQTEEWFTVDAVNILPRSVSLKDTAFLVQLFKKTGSGISAKADDVIKHN
ncbi:MAG: TIR domain-containing protein [Pseudomonadota bacterium]